MHIRPLLIAGLATASLAVTACGSAVAHDYATPSSATSPAPAQTAPPATSPAPSSSASSVAAALQPLGCAAAPDTSTDIVSGDIKPQTSLVCTVSGETVSIAEYANAEQVSATMNLARGIGCQMAAGLGFHGDQDYILAGPVMVTAQTDGTSQRIKSAIPGAAITKVHCS
jgi:hypothetical protein